MSEVLEPAEELRVDAGAVGRGDAATNVVSLLRQREDEGRAARLLELAREELTLERNRAVSAEAEVEQLRLRVEELESWLSARERFETTEQIQLQRTIVAAAARERKERGFAMSPWMLLALLYAAALVAFIWIVVLAKS